MVNFNLKRILCPVDFSQHSAAALRMAGGVARAFGAEVIVLHAQRLEAPVYFTASQTQALKTQLRRSARAARAYVVEFVAKYFPEDLPHSTVLLEDDPALAILRTLRESKAELVVMGTHGRTRLSKVRLGSVTESILRQVAVPILTVGPGVRITASLGTLRRILCPVDYSELARAALEHAAFLAEKTGAELILCHVTERTGDQRLEEDRKVLCDWVAPELHQRCTMKEVVREGKPAEQIVAEAKESRADLLVVGAKPHASLGTFLFGSTTEALIRQAPCPVFTVFRRDRPRDL